MKLVRHATAWFLGFSVLGGVCGCQRDVDLSPPAIQYGQTECEHCRMIVTEERFAAALVVHRDDHVEKFAFDDAGCLFGFLRERTGVEERIPYVHDHETGRWLNARSATFVKSDKLETPMASGLAAVESDAAAQRLLARIPGVKTVFAEILGH